MLEFIIYSILCILLLVFLVTLKQVRENREENSQQEAIRELIGVNLNRKSKNSK